MWKMLNDNIHYLPIWFSNCKVSVKASLLNKYKCTTYQELTGAAAWLVADD